MLEESISDLEPARNGYAIEARINAERVQAGSDGTLTFRPHPGQITVCHFPEAEGVESGRAIRQRNASPARIMGERPCGSASPLPLSAYGSLA